MDETTSPRWSDQEHQALIDEIALLHDAAHSRTVLGQATGLVASEGNLSITEAGQLLVETSSLSNVKIAVVAELLVKAQDGRLETDERATARAVADALDRVLQRFTSNHALRQLPALRVLGGGGASA